MTDLIEAFSKRKIVDIKDSEDMIDKEYVARLMQVTCKRDLISIIDDYEDFLPSGFAKIRDMSEEEVKDLMGNARRFYAEVFHKKVYSGPPNISIMLLQPIMLVYTRMWAIQMTSERSKKNGGYSMTWGQAWKELHASGAVQKMMRQQERLFEMLENLEERQ